MFVTTYSPVNYNRINYNPQVYTKTRNNCADTVSFSERVLTKAERETIINELSDKMKTRPESVQKLYQYGIDYLEGKTDKNAYLDNMYNLLYANNSDFGNTTREERKFIGNYGLAFDEGPITKIITDTDIFDCLKSLLGY